MVIFLLFNFIFIYFIYFILFYFYFIFILFYFILFYFFYYFFIFILFIFYFLIEVGDVGIFFPEQVSTPVLSAGQVGFIIANIKTATEARVGDTFFNDGETVVPFPGFKEHKPTGKKIK